MACWRIHVMGRLAVEEMRRGAWERRLSRHRSGERGVERCEGGVASGEVASGEVWRKGVRERCEWWEGQV